jgi:hypothetical protein
VIIGFGAQAMDIGALDARSRFASMLDIAEASSINPRHEFPIDSHGPLYRYVARRSASVCRQPESTSAPF